MQRRLFLLFLLLMFLPAAAVLLVNWRMSDRHLGLLDSPGLQRAQESSLDLARRTLELEKDRVVAEAVALAAQMADQATPSLPEPAPGCAYLLAPQKTPPILRGDFDPRALWPNLMTTSLERPVRRRHEQGSFVIAAAPLEAGARLIVVRALDSELAATLDTVATGSTSLRQLRLFYGRLLRTDTLLIMTVLAVVLLAISLWLSRRLARQIARPLQELVAGTEQIAGGDLTHRVDIEAPAELGELVGAFNDMTGRLQRSRDELVRAERIAAWQGIARRLAHEIKNPLTPITLAMHRIGNQSQDATVTECVGMVLEETDNLKRLADEFSLYARLPEPERQPLDLHGLVVQVADLYLSRGEIEVSWQGWDQAPVIDGDPGQLRQVFANLLKNAAEAMGGRGTIELDLQVGDEHVIVSIHDSGPGLPEDPGSLFEPYVTTKSSGTGLGLAIARKIIEDHGGRLSAKSATTESATTGAVFKIELPTAEATGLSDQTRKDES